MFNHAFRYRYLLQFVNMFQSFLFCFTYILSGDVSYRIEGRQKESVIEVEDVGCVLAM